MPNSGQWVSGTPILPTWHCPVNTTSTIPSFSDLKSTFWDFDLFDFFYRTFNLSEASHFRIEPLQFLIISHHFIIFREKIIIAKEDSIAQSSVLYHSLDLSFIFSSFISFKEPLEEF